MLPTQGIMYMYFFQMLPHFILQNHLIHDQTRGLETCQKVLYPKYTVHVLSMICIPNMKNLSSIDNQHLHKYDSTAQ